VKKWIVGIHPEKQGFESRWADALTAAGADVKWLDLLAPDALDQARACDGIMWHFPHHPSNIRRARTILHVIETELGIPVFPDLRTAWHFDDKVAQYYLMRAHDIPMPKTWIFWRREEAEQWARTATYPLVFKLSGGAGSSNVFKVDTPREALGWIRRMFSRSGCVPKAHIPAKAGVWRRWWREIRQFGLRMFSAPAYVLQGRYPPLPRVFWLPQKDYVYFQELVQGNEYDARVTVVGERMFAYRRINRPHDFRASGSGVFDVAPDKIDMGAIQLAWQASQKLKMQSMACDILYHPREKKHVITEVSYGYVDWMVAKCPGHWNAHLEWHQGSIWPEQAHVEDFLERIRKQSEARR
jgi:glutathione synthase/RimK-type ligase-like ATP-grasp enzyme